MFELATFGVTVNCVSPGYVWTPLVEKQIPDTMAARNMTREQVIHDVILLAQPTKQFVTADGVASPKVRALTELKLFIAATNVQTGRIKVFEGPELTADHVMASACLPYLFQAVEIDGVPYWDGGYMGNPALFPLFYKTACPDIVIVQINPIERDEVPRSAHKIA